MFNHKKKSIIIIFYSKGFSSQPFNFSPLVMTLVLALSKAF